MPALGKIAVIGPGLIGGSIGLAAKSVGAAESVIGIGRSKARLARAKRQGAIDEVFTDVAKGVREADLAVVCVPVDAVAGVVRQAIGAAPEGAVITDAASTKASIVKAVGRARPRSRVEFVGGHPLAGGHQTGVAAARSDLFAGRTVVLTPTASNSKGAVRRVAKFWRSLGAKVDEMSAATHDRLLASASHAPHLVAAMLAAATRKDSLPYASTGWADATRIAAGDPELWTQIVSSNRPAILKSLERFEKVLIAYHDAIAADDDRRLMQLLEEAKARRDVVGNMHSSR